MIKIKKLRLEKQTVVILTSKELDRVIGGAGNTALGSLHCTEKGYSLCVAYGCV